MADYPTTSFAPTTKSSGQTIAASHMNDVQSEIRAIELALLSTGLAHHLLFVDATYDIGASGATRPRDLFLSRNATIGGTLAVTGATTLTGALTVTAGQIAFPAAQSASAGVNTLDDYEEGPWTPADGSGAGLSIANNGSQYVKAGQLVIVSLDATYPVTADGSSAVISGLPFTNQATNGWGGACHAGIAQSDDAG